MIADLKSLLFPTPTEFIERQGSYLVNETLKVSFQQPSYKNLVSISKLALVNADPERADIRFIQEKFANPDAFKILCDPKGITIFTSTPKAGLFALHLLKQILDFAPKEIPCFEINDFPFLKRRGFMLDVSRCKVPTMESIFEFIDLLSILRFNEFQLYIEHTFAFQNHRDVWKDSSPLSGEEIQKIDHYCRDRFIDLVPNLNSFGHFERWLRHKPYKILAECPDGFRREEPFMVRDHGSVLKPNQDSLKFIDSLYEEYLPNFSSAKFNVGLDEPWELGQGWSKPIVEKDGKHTVYLDYLSGILKLVEKRGKSMEFWADVLLEKPENARNLPISASPVIWGYEPEHPFNEQAKILASCGLRYSLAPGTANWRSFSGRWDTVRQNIADACRVAKEYNAEGILLTSWGDCGNHQPWATIYPPLFLGAQLAWNGKGLNDEDIGSALDNLVFRKNECGLGINFIHLACLDQIMDFKLPNNSLPWFALFSAQPEKLPGHLLEQTSLEQMKKGLAWLEQLNDKIFSFTTDSPAHHAEVEWRLGIELSMIGTQHAISLIDSGSHFPDTSKNYNQVLENFQNIWLLRARKGGLTEAIQLLKNALPIA